MARFLLLLALGLQISSVLGSPRVQLRRPLNFKRDFALERRASADSACPDGYLCNQGTCSANILCPAGTVCINLEGAIACAPAGQQWCALNPTSLQAVSCGTGSKCCHGNCYTSNTVCCGNMTSRCTIGNLCGACASGQSCGTNGACGGAAPATTSTSTSKSASTLPVISISTSISTSKSTSISTTTSVPSLPAPTEQPSFDKWGSLGCWSDDSLTRALANQFLDASGMTVKVCSDKAAGFKYFGVEYGTECYYGNILTGSTKKGSGCDTACVGLKTQQCGGGYLMNLYQNSAYVPPTTTTAVPVGPTALPYYGLWASTGCWSDDTNARGLENSYTDNAAMSVKLCTEKAAGFKYMAVEYSVECRWGNVLASSSTKQTSGCDMACAGAKSEQCGGGNRMNVYQNSAYSPPAVPTVVPYWGSFLNPRCFPDSIDLRYLRDGSSTDNSMTVQKCANLASGWRHFGVEYGIECFWGEIPRAVENVALTDCDMKCGGDQKALCGGGNRVLVYENVNWVNPTRVALANAINAYMQAVVDYSKLQTVARNLLRDLVIGAPGRKRQPASPTLEAGFQLKRKIRNFLEVLAVKAPETRRRSVAPSSESESKILVARGPADDVLRAFVNLFTEGQTLNMLAADVRTWFQRSRKYELITEAESGIEMDLLNQMDEVIANVADIANTVQTAISSGAAKAAAVKALSDTIFVIGAGTIITAAATGIAKLLHTFWVNFTGGNGAPTAPAPTKPPTGTTTAAAATTTSSTSCNPSATATGMVVMTKPGTSAASYQALLAKLPKGGFVKDSQSPNIGVYFFLVNMKPCDAQNIIKEAVVQTISVNIAVRLEADGPLTKRQEQGKYSPVAANKTTSEAEQLKFSDMLNTRAMEEGKTLILQYPAPLHLRWLSAPWSNKGNFLSSPRHVLNTDGYLYDFNNNDPVWIYIFDSGLSHPENMQFASPDMRSSRITGWYDRHDAEAPTVPFDNSGHGTHMASMAAGIFSGAAKTAQLVIVKSDVDDGTNDLFVWMDTLRWVMNDVYNNNRQGSAVLSMSHVMLVRNLMEVSGLDPETSDPIPAMMDAFITNMGIVAVTSAGNTDNELSDYEPRASGGTNRGMIVVGAAHLNGEKIPWSAYQDSQGLGILSIYALGEEMCGGYYLDPNALNCVSGTSGAAATIAGLVAYHLANSVTRASMIGVAASGGADYTQVSRKMKEFLQFEGVLAKGFFGDSIPRAALREDLACTFTGDEGTAPTAIPPQSQGLQGQYYVSSFGPAYSLFLDDDSNVLSYTPALRLASVGLAVTLDQASLPEALQCVVVTS